MNTTSTITATVANYDKQQPAATATTTTRTTNHEENHACLVLVVLRSFLLLFFFLFLGVADGKATEAVNQSLLKVLDTSFSRASHHVSHLLTFSYPPSHLSHSPPLFPLSPSHRLSSALQLAVCLVTCSCTCCRTLWNRTVVARVAILTLTHTLTLTKVIWQ